MRDLRRPHTLDRRRMMAGSGAALASALDFQSRRSFASNRTLRIGFQKYGTLILLKGKAALEKALAPLGYAVSWAEFPAGPQLLEALNVGAIDFGSVGEAPPIFAQAAGAPIVYVAHEPAAPRGEAILVPRESPITSLADLRGKRIALNKGSNVHYLLVRALEKAGIRYGDIQTAFLPPADARAAFEHGAVDAWVIWDPFLAAAEAATGARTLVNGEGLVANRQFFVGARNFVERNSEALDRVIAQINIVDAWVNGNAAAVADELSASVGIPADILKTALKRQTFEAKPLSAAVVAEQQKIADAFLSLRLIPKAVKVADAVRRAAS